MTKQLVKVTYIVMAFALFFTPIQVEAITKPPATNQCVSQAAVQFAGQMRKLWIDHAVWTRNYIVSATAGLEDQQKVLARLLKNQEDLGNAIKPYYGEAAGNQLTKLLKEHIIIAGNIVEAAKTGNQANLKKNNADWYRNADEIAEFLSKANPNWPKAKLQQLLQMHLQLVADDLMARLKKDWDTDILAFDKGLDHIIVMADTLSEGIIKQFPTKF